MNNFEYTRASDVADAVRQISADPGAKFIAGGTNLIDLMKENVARPTRLIDITHLPLNKIEETKDGGLRIGALVPNSDLAYHPQIAARYPLLASAILAGASAQLRNMASTGGNLLQRTRCFYFYDTTTPCNKREPGSGCSALEGFNRGHAILGTSEHCIALHPSDVAIPLVAFDAIVHTTEKSVPFDDFFLLPGTTPALEHPLAQGEMITAIEVPAAPIARRSVYFKFRDRQSYEFALVSVAAAIEVRDGAVADVRLALGGVGTKPWRFRRAEAALIGAPADAQAFRRAALAELEDAVTHEHNAFKIELAARAAVRGLTEAMG